MKITGYTRFTDDVVKEKIRKYARSLSKRGVGIFNADSPLCSVDLRTCRDKGRIKTGSCNDPFSLLDKLGKCRKVQIEYEEKIQVTEVNGNADNSSNSR